MAEATRELSGVQVAVVEDDPMLRESLAFFLQVRGCRVETFESAEHIQGAGIPGGFDVVISDYLLAGEDGLSLLRKVRESSRSVVTILVTAQRNRDFLEETVRAGIDACLPKPFSTEELEGTLQRLIAKGRGGDPALNEEIA